MNSIVSQASYGKPMKKLASKAPVKAVAALKKPMKHVKKAGKK